MWLFNKPKPEKPKSLLDQVQQLAGPIIVNGYRHIAKTANLAPTSKTSDQEIIVIYQQVGSAFREASKERKEHLPAEYLNSIVLKFLQIYENMGKDFYYEHLKYEVDKYINEGLREDYKKNLKLF